MNKYKVKVESPGEIIFFKNRKIRSPFTLEIYESEINLIKSAMLSSVVTEFSIDKVTKTDDDVEEETWEDFILDPESEEVIVEELEEPKTLLEKLLRDDKNGE